jgi:hypothetical protein
MRSLGICYLLNCITLDVKYKADSPVDIHEAGGGTVCERGGSEKMKPRRLEYWKNGMLEYWRDGFQCSIIPIFQSLIIVKGSDRAVRVSRESKIV